MLVNITGGADLTLGEVHQINEIIHDAVGDDAEIIFGAVHEPAMQGEIRVTVIATGFDKALQPGHRRPPTSSRPWLPRAPVIPFPANRPSRTGTIARPIAGSEAARPRQPQPPTQPQQSGERSSGSQDLSDMEIPTFIRRQMD